METDRGRATLTLDARLTVSCVRGSEDPIAGWASSGYHRREPAWTVSAGTTLTGNANMGPDYNTLPGYQLGYPEDDQAKTVLIQATAIQGAISDMGVRYNMGPYSFGAQQRVLTPDAVVRSKSGICIETALLVASVLQSADMHPMVLILPGHAQVALETWEGSGQYVLLETTLLPFTGADGQVMQYITTMSNDEWNAYLADDGTYVIDCDLASTLGIRGLAL